MDGFDKREFGAHLAEELKGGRLSRRDFLRRATVVGISLPTAALLLEACGSNASSSTTTGPKGSKVSNNQSARHGGVLKVGSSAPVAAPNPVTMYDSGSIAIVQMMCEYLIWVNTDYSLRPVLATSWKPNGTGDVWTFSLRKGVKFSDGRPFTAKDVVATFNRLVNPKSNSAALSNFQGILAPGGTEAVDDYTVRFNLERPFVDFPYTVASTNYNAVVLPHDYAGDFMKSPIGTGSFVLTSYNSSTGAQFKANPHYWASNLPYLDGVDITYYASDGSAELALQASSVDLILVGAIPAGSALLSQPGINVGARPSSAFWEFWMRADKPPFTDVRVRQAMALALDRPQMVTTLFGTQKTSVGNDNVWQPVFADYSGMPAQRSQNISKAKSLLTAAGHPHGFTFTLTTENSGSIPQYAALVKSNAAKIGVTINLDIMTQNAFYGSGNNQPWLEVPLGIVDWGARATAQQFWSSAFVCKGIWNSAHWCSDRYTQLGKTYEATVDESSRRKVAAKMATIQTTEVPAIVAFWEPRGLPALTKVHGVDENGTEFLDLTRVWLS